MATATEPDERAAARRTLTDLFTTAVAAAHPARRLPPVLRGLLADERRARAAASATLLIAFGKAAGSMTRAALPLLEGPVRGLVVAPRGYLGEWTPPDGSGIETIESGHPVPDEASERAARRALALAGTAKRHERVLFLASGGGSAAMAAPRPPLTLDAKRAIVRHLVLSGAPIDEINLVRRHLSTVKGGRLAKAAAGAACHWTLAISDVVGDDPALIASGPSIPADDETAAARAVLERRKAPYAALWQAVLAHAPRTPDDAAPPPRTVHLVARAADAIAAAAERARKDGWRVHVLGTDLAGEAGAAAQDHAALARRLHAAGGRHLILSGGELTVRVETDAPGHGGPNLEYLAHLMIALDGLPGVHALAADTDGRDGSGGQAGGLLHPDSPARARALGLDPRLLLARHDTRALFAALGDLLETGPIPVNVNDFRAILVAP